MELEYRFAGMDELDFLVRMRIRDLRMFSECAAGTKLEDAIRRCLNSSEQALGMYERMGFYSKKGYLVYYLN